MNGKTAVLVGASGLVGRYCLELLRQDGRYERIAILARRTSSIDDPRVVQHLVDFDRPEGYAHLVQADELYCCLGTTLKTAGSREAFRKVDCTYPRELARIASHNGVKRFLLVSGLGADPRSWNFYLRAKGETETAVRALPFQGTYFFRPSLLTGRRSEPRLREQLGLALMAPAAFLFVGPLRKYRPIAAIRVAQAMISVANEGLLGVHVFESDRIEALAAARHDYQDLN